jgi:flagellar hook-length control protein FliK
VVGAAPAAEESATPATPAAGESSAPAVAGPTELPVPAISASGQEQAGADAQNGERPAGTLTPLAAPAAPAPAGTVPAPAAPPAPAPPPAPVATQVAPVVAQLAGGADGTHTMTLVLRPETLGTVEVRVTVSQGIVDLTLRHASEAGRAALLDALPDLRRDLEASGLTCSKLDVDRDSGNAWTSSQQQGAEQRAREAAAGRERPWLRGPEADGSRPAPVVHSPSSGLDVRV